MWDFITTLFTSEEFPHPTQLYVHHALWNSLHIACSRDLRENHKRLAAPTPSLGISAGTKHNGLHTARPTNYDTLSFCLFNNHRPNKHLILGQDSVGMYYENLISIYRARMKSHFGPLVVCLETSSM